MSKFDEELRRRILRGDDLAETRRWFTERVAETDLRETDFTELELKFWRDTVEAFEEWQANRKLN